MARQYGWGVVHLDDFFLQPIQRTPKRMAEPGGNLDRERLIAEVLEPLRAGQQGSYRLFDCRTMALVPGTVPLPRKSWKISKPDGSPKRKPILHISRSRNGAR